MLRFASAVVIALTAGAFGLFGAEGEARKKLSVPGTVKMVDVKGGTISIEGRKHEGKTDPPITFALGKDVSFTVDGKAAKLADLKPGTAVTLTVAEDRQTVVAIAVPPRREGGEREGGRRSPIVSGFVTKVEGNKFTITRRGDGGERSQTVTIDANTRVQVQTDQDETVKGEGGRERKVPKVAKGAAADVKVGKYVAAAVGEGERAVRVTVLRGQGKDGGR